MPFDGLTNERQLYLLDKLAAVSDLFSSEQKWCKREMRTPDGGRCVVGALIDVDARWLLYRPIIAAAREVTGRAYHRVEAFNDDSATSFADVQAVLERVRVTLIAGTARSSLSQNIICFLQRRAERAATRWGCPRVMACLTFPW
jgi:hypothetical protein